MRIDNLEDKGKDFRVRGIVPVIQKLASEWRDEPHSVAKVAAKSLKCLPWGKFGKCQGECQGMELA